MVTLDELLDSGEARERSRLASTQAKAAAGTGVFWLGWLAAKTALFLMLCVAAPFIATGYVASRVAWPAMKWGRAAFMLGWEAGRGRAAAR